MIDFDRKPTPRSKEEEELEALIAEYLAVFGKPYVFAVGINSDTMPETVADIRRRIAENDPQPAPDYEKDAEY
jgi:2-oxo-4-hydroxy-4-carboxy--5-ureidoimidazoline (OHCU) decarboxylase